MNNIASTITNFLFPIFCVACKTFNLEKDDVLCIECSGRIRPIISYDLSLTPSKQMTVHAVGAYDQPLVSLILAKSSGKRAIAHQLGTLAWHKSAVRHVPFDCIVPIPLHWTRYAWRGYNQADEIAGVLAEESNKPLLHVLSRIRRTPFQSLFEGDARIENVSGAFALKGIDFDLKEKHILLVDDVMTSGATLRFAARELLKLRPKKITAVVISRVA